MITSDHTGELLAALLKARAQFQTIRKTERVRVTTKTGRSYDFNYAPLEVIQAATEPALWAEGLQLVSAVQPGPDGTVEVVTRLLHTSEQWIESRIPSVPLEDVKALGGFVSYARRYSTVALLDLSADDDLDGTQATGDHIEPRTNAASVPATNGHTPTPAPPKGSPKNLVQKADLLQQIQGEITRLGRSVEGATRLYPAAFGDEVTTWELVCGESLHTLKHGLVYLKTLTPEPTNGAQSSPAQVPASTATPAPTAESPASPVPATSSSAPEPEDDAAERDRQRLRAEVASWPLRVSEAEVEHIIMHHPYSRARTLLWQARRQETAAD